MDASQLQEFGTVDEWVPERLSGYFERAKERSSGFSSRQGRFKVLTASLRRPVLVGILLSPINAVNLAFLPFVSSAPAPSTVALPSTPSGTASALTNTNPASLLISSSVFPPAAFTTALYRLQAAAWNKALPLIKNIRASFS